MMQTYKMVVAYDGTNYAGWQVQTEQQAIVNVLQSRFYHAFKKDIKIVGASRTDAGVHALGQVAKFETDIPLEYQRICRIWNDALPLSVSITHLEPCEPDFSPLHNVVQKTYWYHISLQKPSPFVARYCYYIPYKIDLEKLKESLKIFIGTHDFRSFVSAQETRECIRTIDHIELDFNDQLQAYRITIKGKSFLRYMIRRIVGACLYASAKSDIGVDYLSNVLQEKNPYQALPTAPSHGLLLYAIKYK